MTKHFELTLTGLVIIAAIVSFSYVEQSRQQAKQDQLAAQIQAEGETPFQAASRSKGTGCQVRGPLPDSACSPGAIFPDASRETICVKGYTQSVRNVSTSLKKKVYAEYGLTYPQATGAFEVDHLIPLELGGSNDIANLFPEAAKPAPGFHEKDLVENYLNHEVCAGRLSLAGAQRQIATDWLAVYSTLTPDQLDQLRAEFRFGSVPN